MDHHKKRKRPKTVNIWLILKLSFSNFDIFFNLNYTNNYLVYFAYCQAPQHTSLDYPHGDVWRKPANVFIGHIYMLSKLIQLTVQLL